MVIKIELGQKIIGALPYIGSHCLALVKGRFWTLGYWRYIEHEILFELQDGDFMFNFEEIKFWIELPEELKND